MESRESSSPLVTRAVAAGLQGFQAPGYDLAGWQRFGLRVVGLLPSSVGAWLVPRMQAPGAVNAVDVRKMSLQDLLAARLQDYAGLRGKFPAVTAGVALGGPTTHLSLALRAPFLPQAFVISMKGGSKRANPREYYLRSADLALELAERNPDILTIQHFDPVHDGWLTRQINHLRIKLLGLPDVYREFLRARLEPGGELVYLDGGARWLRYRVGARSVFQVGGWGDISAREFLDGSDRLRAFMRQENLGEAGWKLDGVPLEEGPESEWGSEPGLGESLEAFCQSEGFKFVRIALPEPNDFSRLAFFAQAQLLKGAGIEPSGVLVEMFSQFDAAAVTQAGLLPLWLIFNTADSLAFLRSMQGNFPKDKPVFFSPLSTFTRTPDIVPWRKWEEVLRGFEWTNVGARASHYPADTRAVVDWRKPLQAWAAGQPVLNLPRLTATELSSLAIDLQKPVERIT